MTEKNDGGHAFASKFQIGMSLRDYFAGQAIIGSNIMTSAMLMVAANNPAAADIIAAALKDIDEDSVAAGAYKTANAMLKARDQ